MALAAVEEISAGGAVAMFLKRRAAVVTDNCAVIVVHVAGTVTAKVAAKIHDDERAGGKGEDKGEQHKRIIPPGNKNVNLLGRKLF